MINGAVEFQLDAIKPNMCYDYWCHRQRQRISVKTLWNPTGVLDPFAGSQIWSQIVYRELTLELDRSTPGRSDFGAILSHSRAHSWARPVNKRRWKQKFQASVHKKLGETSCLNTSYSDSMYLKFWFCKYSHFSFLTLDQPFWFFNSNLNSSLVHRPNRAAKPPIQYVPVVHEGKALPCVL